MGIVDEDVLAEQNLKFRQMSQMIVSARTIAICAHTNPDGDALGSGLGLALIIKGMWPEKTVTNLLADDDPVPRLYRFLAGASDFVHCSDYATCPDLFICVDLPSADRLNEAQAVLERSGHVICIDHHPARERLGDVMLSRVDAAATGVVVAELAEWLHADVTPDLANCLYCAIVTDTGRFQYQNADAEAFSVASMLVDCGASPSLISLNVYQSFRIEYLHLEAIVMGRITTFANGRIAYSYALKEDLERTGAKNDECDGLVDVVRSVAGCQICLFLKESCQGKVRGNLRAKNDLDVSKIAQVMGGGGHVAAAGFTFEGDIDDALARVLPMLQELVGEDPTGSWAPLRGSTGE
ncbi:MAG: DHH family phosphoesterase [Atopobiaceae bacterium]|jgi:phosphoesterase RecJ-like protein